MTDAVDIDVRGVSKVYGKVSVLDDVSFHVPAGSTLSLLGPSGCGKSTTLSILAGITEAQTGQVFFGGKPMNNVAVHRRRVGVVFQSYALFPHMTVQRNVEFGPRVQGKSKKECADAAARALKMTHLTDFAQRKPKELSGGQRQRVAIARAIASNPQVLLMDEPLSSLDANLREEMQFEIRDLQRQTGISMIFVTHDQQEAMAVGDQLGILFDGRMRQVGAATDLYDRPVDVDVAKFLGKANLFPVKIGSVRDGRAELVGPSGERWSGVVPAGVQVSAGDGAQLMVRPEALALYTNGVPEGHNSVRGTVTRATFLGREANVVVSAASIDLELRCGTDQGGSLRPGDEVSVGWTVERSAVFPLKAPTSDSQDQDLAMRPSTKLSPAAEAPGPQAPPPAAAAAHAQASRPHWGRFAPLLLTAPALLILLFIFVTPAVLLVIVSFFPNDDLTGMHSGFHPANYNYFWTQRYFFSAMGRTFGVALLTTLLTAVISYPLALVLNRRGRGVRVVVALIVVLPIFVSMVERTLGWLSIYGSGGLLDRFGSLFGFRFPSLLYSERGLIIGLTNMLLPFMFLSVYAAVRRIDPLVREAAATLGASPVQVFWRVTLPLTYSGLAAGATLVFSLAASNVIVTMMLGGTGMTTLPTLLYEEATVSVNYPLSAVVGVSVSALILVAIWVIMRLGGKNNRHETVVLP